MGRVLAALRLAGALAAARSGLIALWLLAAAATTGLAALTIELTRKPGLPEPHAEEPGSEPRRPNPFARWTVTGQLSAHHVLILHVETTYLSEARAIARQLADPVASRYAEILIYFHRPGRPETLAPRRVQWTPKEGYVETIYGK